MKLKLDENLGRRCAEVFRDSGQDVLTVVDQGMASSTDADLIEVCHIEGRCLVTLDLDFSNPLRFPPHDFSGIAVLRPPAPIRLDDLLQCCRTLMAGFDQEPIVGKLWIVETSRIRRYQPENDAS